MTELFVTRYGLLPFDENGDLRVVTTGAPWHAVSAPLAWYRALAEHVAALVEAEVLLRAGCPGGRFDGERIRDNFATFKGWPALILARSLRTQFKGLRRRSPARAHVPALAHLCIELSLRDLFEATHVSLEVSYPSAVGARLSFAGEEPLFALIRGLVNQMGPEGVWAVCADGGHLYRREDGRRSPKRGQRSYCLPHGAEAGYRDSVRRVKRDGAKNPRLTNRRRP